MTEEIVIGGDMADIPEGTYPATLKSMAVKHSEKFGSDFRAWDFELANGSIVGGSSSTATNSRSKGGKWIAALLGRKPVEGESINLIGRPCLVVVVENDGWPKVDAVLPPMAAPAPLQPIAPLVAVPTNSGQPPELP